MDTTENTNENGLKRKVQLEDLVSADKKLTDITLNPETMKNFFHLTGGSLLYCISAVLVAYGIVNVMGPILSGQEAMKDILPCILTLQVYEMALLGVLILIVSKKVVDDAISISVLIALFLVGTSMALGSVADRDTSTALWIGLIGIGLGLGKLYLMRHFAGIRFRVLSFVGLGVLIACNYLGPVLMARSISADPSGESARKGLWLFVWLIMLIGAGFVLVEAIKGRPHRQTDKKDRAAFLHTPIMVYVFTLILIAASGVHQYATAFTFALERVVGDFVPAVAVATLLMLEILRHSGKRFGVTEVVISCVPLATMMLAIYDKSVLASGQFGLGLMCYPPVILALCGLAIVGLALHRRCYPFLAVAFFYGLGVILTAGFSPENPHDLNIHACFETLVVSLLVFGAIRRNQYLCTAGIIVLCFDLAMLDAFSKFTASCHLTEVGGLAGVCGFGLVALYIAFGRRLHRALQIFGILCLAGFVFDYLPDDIHWRYLVILPSTVLLTAVLWFRTKDILAILILWVPSFTRLYILARNIAYWRFVILGFLMLGAGAVISLLKRPTRNRANQENES